MPEPEFDQVYEGFEDIAPRVFLHDGRHSFIVAVAEAGQLEVYEMQFDSQTSKQHTYGLLERRYRGQAEFYVQICEAWMVKLSNALDDVIGQLMPSKHPERVEVLEICGGHRDGRRRLTTWEIKRDPLRLEKLEMADARGAGVWDRLLLGDDVQMMKYDDSGRLRLP